MRCGDGSMNATMVIPSYWARESKVGWQEGDAVYDHPTPLDSEGTLLRAIQSLGILKDKEFQLIVLAVATSKDITGQVEKKLENIIASASSAVGIKVSLFGNSHLAKLHDILADKGKEEMVVFDISMRIPGSPLTRFTPHSGYLYGDSISYGERIAMEIKKAAETNQIIKIVT